MPKTEACSHRNLTFPRIEQSRPDDFNRDTQATDPSPRPHGKAVLQIYIPFYRDREKLERAIESVQRQTSSDVLLTVLDDASETFADGATDFFEQYPDVRYSRNPQNLGMVGNWNRSFEDDSPMLSILHADDELLPDYAEAMQDAAAKYPEASLLFCRAKIIDDKGRELFSFPDYVKRFLYSQKGDVTLEGEEAVASLLRGNYIFCPTVAFQVENLNGIRFDPRWRFVQDLDFVLRVLEAGQKVVGLEKTCYAYRRHANNATAEYTVSNLRFREETQLYDELAKRYEERGWHRAARLARRRTILKLNLTYCTLQDILRFRFSDAWQKVRLFGELFFGLGRQSKSPAEA